MRDPCIWACIQPYAGRSNFTGACLLCLLCLLCLQVFTNKYASCFNLKNKQFNALSASDRHYPNSRKHDNASRLAYARFVMLTLDYTLDYTLQLRMLCRAAVRNLHVYNLGSLNSYIIPGSPCTSTLLHFYTSTSYESPYRIRAP